MKHIKVPAIYIASDRINTAEEKARLKRMLSKISSKVEISLEAKHIEDIIKDSQLFSKDERTGMKRKNNPSIIFSGFDWDDEKNDPLNPQLRVKSIFGRSSFIDLRDAKELLRNNNVLCNSGHEFHTAFGCFNSCSYCHVGDHFTIMLDIEKCIEKLGVFMGKHPGQKLYKYDNQSDIMLLEPEYGATKELVEFFAKEDEHIKDKYLMLYTKSDNVDFLQNLDHKGKTIVCITMSCDDVAKKYEHGTPGQNERIKAARKCREWGYEIRIRGGIIPVYGWKSKSKEMIEEVFSKIRPEVICLEALCHMTKEQCNNIFPDLMYQPQENATEYELFSHKDRRKMYKFFLKEIRKHAPDVKIALCLETPRMWNDLRHLLKQDSRNFYCCCGADCVKK